VSGELPAERERVQLLALQEGQQKQNRKTKKWSWRASVARAKNLDCREVWEMAAWVDGRAALAKKKKDRRSTLEGVIGVQ